MDVEEPSDTDDRQVLDFSGLPEARTVLEFFGNPTAYDPRSSVCWMPFNPINGSSIVEAAAGIGGRIAVASPAEATSAASVVDQAFPAAFAAVMAASSRHDGARSAGENAEGLAVAAAAAAAVGQEVAESASRETEAAGTGAGVKRATCALIMALEAGEEGESAVEHLCAAIPAMLGTPQQMLLQPLWGMVDDNGNGAFMLALKKSKDHVAEALYACLPDERIDQQNLKGATALCLAAQKGNRSIARRLLQRGANPNILYENGSTALLQASHFGREEIAEMLIEAKADVDLANKKGTTALMRASQEGHIGVVKLLVRAGASVNNQNDERMTPLMLGSQRGHSHIAKALVHFGADLEMQTVQGSTALMLACKRAHVNVVRVLLAAGAEMRTEDNRGRTAKDTAYRRALNAPSETAAALNRIVDMLKAGVQKRLMQDALREKRSYLLMKCYRLVEHQRAVPIVPHGCRARSYHVLSRATRLPHTIFRKVVEFMPLPHIWLAQLHRLTRRAEKHPDEATRGSIELMKEIVHEIIYDDDDREMPVRRGDDCVDYRRRTRGPCAALAPPAAAPARAAGKAPAPAPLPAPPAARPRARPAGASPAWIAAALQPAAPEDGNGTNVEEASDIDEGNEQDSDMELSAVTLEHLLAQAKLQEGEAGSRLASYLTLDHHLSLEHWAHLERTMLLFPKCIRCEAPAGKRATGFTRWLLLWRDYVRAQAFEGRDVSIADFEELRGAPMGLTDTAREDILARERRRDELRVQLNRARQSVGTLDLGLDGRDLRRQDPRGGAPGDGRAVEGMQRGGPDGDHGALLAPLGQAAQGMGPRNQ